MRIRHLSLATLLLGSLAACAAKDNTASDESHWDTESANDETRSTHLWVVDRGMDILSRHVAELPGAANTLAWMSDAQCKENWHRGLIEADFLAPFNAAADDLPVPSGGEASNVEEAAGSFLVVANHASWMSHFYDPSTGKNYEGFAVSTDLSRDLITLPAYAQIRRQVEVNGPVPLEAKGAALYRLDRAKKLLSGIDTPIDHRSEPRDMRARGCYELGLALHYFTDITQPMHAANFAATDAPALLHSNWETYAESVQAKFVRADWSGTAPIGATADVIQSAAITSKAHFRREDGGNGPLFSAIVSAYLEGKTWDAEGTSHHDDLCSQIGFRVIVPVSVDVPQCWRNNPAVLAETGEALGDAQELTARFLGSLALPPQ